MDVVIIEQDRDLLDSITRYCGSLGFNVYPFFDPVNAINSLPQKADLLLVDGNIPRIKYPEVAEIFQKRFPGLKVVVLDDDFDIGEGKVDETFLLLKRPFVSDDFDKVVRK